jgi:NADH-quinone oxidoreductase subunit E
MICGAEDLVAVCKAKIAANPHELSPDGEFSWEEVECLGACSNAPMAQIGKDYYEDLTAKKLETILATLAKGEVPAPGPQNGRYASEPVTGLTSLDGKRHHDTNASITLALAKGDTVARIMGEPPVIRSEVASAPAPTPQPKPAPVTPAADEGAEPAMLSEARGGAADDLKKIKGVGPKLEGILNGLGVYHFDQIAAWTEAEIIWVDDRLKFKGRIVRDGWIDQTKTLMGKG